MRMRSRWRLSVILILASTSVGTWILVNRESGAIGDTTPATLPVTGPVTSALVTTVPTTLPTLPATTPPTTTAAALLPSPPPNPGDTTIAKRGTLILSFDFDGVFVPIDPFELKLKVRSYQGDFEVIKAVEPGSKVAKGDVLLQLDSQKIDAQIAAADNELVAANANLAKADSDVKLGDAADTLAMTTAKTELGFAQADVKRWDDTDGPANVLAGGMEIKQVQASLDDAVDELNELKKMYKSEDLTNQTADIVMKRAARGVELDKISAQVAKASSDRAQNFTPAVTRQHLVDSVDQRTQAVDSLTAAQAQGKVLRATTLVSAHQAVDDATRKLADLKQDKSNFSITSPIDGFVVFGSFSHKSWQEMDRDKLSPGSKLAADQVLMTVFTPGKLRAITDWPEKQLSLLTPAPKVKVSAIAIPELSYDGTIQPAGMVGLAGNDGQSFDVKVDLPDVDVRLIPGYKATLSIDAGKAENVLLLPASAVYHGKVWVHGPGGEDVPVPVVVGRSDGKQVEIKDGLPEGQAVLTTAKHP